MTELDLTQFEGHTPGPTDDDLERICDAHWNHGGEGVIFTDIHQHNATNHTLSGRISTERGEFGFVIHNGDWCGTKVDQWGDPEDIAAYKPEPVELRTFVPKNAFLSIEKPHMFRVYAAWRKESWFQDMERNYNYDRHFQPGGKVESHYAEKAAKRGMKPGYLSAFTSAELAILAKEIK